MQLQKCSSVQHTKSGAIRFIFIRFEASCVTALRFYFHYLLALFATSVFIFIVFLRTLLPTLIHISVGRSGGLFSSHFLHVSVVIYFWFCFYRNLVTFVCPSSCFSWLYLRHLFVLIFLMFLLALFALIYFMLLQSVIGDYCLFSFLLLFCWLY